jgi:soluble lytic murein transglycosylase-like protein
MELISYTVTGYLSHSFRQMVWASFNAGAVKWAKVDERTPYADIINRYSREAGVSARLTAAVIQTESSSQPRALSSSGAYGLMQIMPDTWRQVNQASKVCSGRHTGPCTSECYYNPELNIRIGTIYLAQLLARYDGKPVWALAAYNAGPGAVDRYGGIPPFSETMCYIERVIINWYDLTGTGIPTYDLTANRWARIQTALGWCSIFTASVMLLIGWRLFRRYHSWRWR